MPEVTISQALRQIKEIKGRLAKHRTNAAAAVRHLEKNPPAYSFQDEVFAASAAVARLLELKTAVRAANTTTSLPWDGRTVLLAWAVARLEELKGLIAWYETLPSQPQVEVINLTWDYVEIDGDTKRVRIEEKMICALPEAERDREVEKAKNEFTRLNDLVESLNHRTILKSLVDR